MKLEDAIECEKELVRRSRIIEVIEKKKKLGLQIILLKNVESINRNKSRNSRGSSCICSKFVYKEYEWRMQ